MLKDLLIVFGASFLPFSELRGSIPLGIFACRLPPFLVFFAAVLGNSLIAPFLLIFFRYFSGFLARRYCFFDRFFKKIFSKTRKRYSSKFERWRDWALVILVAIPLPFTGAWTGSLAAFVFGVPFKKACWLIALGVLIAGVIITGLSLFGEGVFLRFLMI